MKLQGIKSVVAGEDLKLTCNYNRVRPNKTGIAFYIGSSVYIITEVDAMLCFFDSSR